MSQRKLKKLRKTIDEKVEVKTGIEGKGLMEVIKKIIFKEWIYLALMTFLSLVVYGNSLGANFVSDDYASITQNTQINDFWYMFSSGNSMSFSTYLVNQLFGNASPIPYHLLNWLTLVLFCWIAYLFLEVVFDNKWVTRLTMLLFVFLPIHVEAVTWISGRIYLILATYIMIGLLGFVFFIRENNYKYLVIPAAAFILGFLTDKPRPFALFLLIPLYLITFGTGKVKINWLKFLGSGMVILGIGIALAWPYIVNRVGIVNSGYNSSESIFYNPFFQYPTGLSKYFQLMLLPVDLTLYHTMYVFPAWLNWLILIMYLVMMIYFYFRNKPYFFALGFIVAGVLPSIMPIKVSWLVAERYMFLGSLGFCLFLALILVDLSRFHKFIPSLILGVLIPYYGVRIFLRNVDWQTNHNLWVNTCQVSPNSHNAWNNIGDDYDKLKQYDNAIKGFTQSTVIKSNYADAYHNRANIFYKIGRLDLARDSYNTALYYSPGLFQTYLSLVQIDLMEKKYDLAIEQAGKAVQLQPDNPTAAYVLAIVYAQANQTDKAKNILEAILKQYPGFKQAADAWRELEKVKIGET